MNWMDKRVEEAQALAHWYGLVRLHADGIYESLWRELVANAKYANDKHAKNLTTGGAGSRIVRLPTGPELRVNLAEDKRSVTVSGCSINLTLVFDVAADGVVYLKWNDAPVSVADAAIEIMDRLLFPELPRLQKGAE